MGDTLKVELCMGSSCFVRGNAGLLEVLENLIEAQGWRDRISLSGLRCENHCTEGPNIRIDGQLYTHMDEGTLIDLLKANLGVPSTSVRLTGVRKTSDRKGI